MSLTSGNEWLLPLDLSDMFGQVDPHSPAATKEICHARNECAEGHE